MQTRRLLLLAALVLCQAPSLARAARVAVLAPQLKPAAAVELRDKFHDAIVWGLWKAGEVIPGIEVRTRLAPTPELLNCTAGPCAARAAALLRVDRVVTVEIDDIGKDYAIRLRAFDEAGTEVAAPPEEKCDICTVREATRAAERLAEKAVPLVARTAGRAPMPLDGDPGLREGGAPPPRPPAPSSLRSPPAEAPASTAPAAVTPAATAAPAREAAKAPSAPPSEAAPAPVPTRPRDEGRGNGLRIGSYTAFAVAGVSILAMISFSYYATLEGPRGTISSYTCNATDPQHNCPRIYSGNTAPAVLFGVLAGLSAATGAVLLYYDLRGAKRPPATVMAAPLPGGLGLSGSFEF